MQINLPLLFKNLISPKYRGWTLAGGVAVIGLGLLYASVDTSSIGDSFMGTAAQMVLKTAVVVGLLYLTLAGLKRWQGGTRREKQIAIVETLRLSPKQNLHLIRAGGRLLLIGASDAHIGLVTEVTAESQTQPSQAVQPAPSDTFATYLAQFAQTQPEPSSK